MFLPSSDVKLIDLVQDKTAQMIFKASKKSHLFHDRDGHHAYNFRGSNKLHQPKVRTTQKSTCISVRGVFMWNDLAEERKLCHSIIHTAKTEI